MSHDVSLTDPVTHETLRLAESHQMRGGTYCVGGTPWAELNVTYNYAKHLWRVLGEGGIKALYGKSGAESIPILEAAAAKLKDDATDNYWDGTEGNTKRALLHLLALARLRPDGIWDGD